jgi:hypothetical protein
MDEGNTRGFLQASHYPEEERAICMGLNQVVLSEGRGCWVLQP